MYTTLFNNLYTYTRLKKNGSLAKFKIISQDWGWGDVDGPDIETEISLDQPFYVNYETQAIRQFMDGNAKLSKKLNSIAQNAFNKTHSSASVEAEVVSYLQSVVSKGASKLKEPYASIVLSALGNVHWESAVSSYTEAYGGPQFDSDEDELAAFNDMLSDFDVPKPRDTGKTDEGIRDEDIENYLADMDTGMDDFVEELGLDGYIDDSGEFVPYPHYTP